jgi:hypothetical protein
MAVVDLILAYRAFVDDRIACDMLQRFLDRNMPPRLADHYTQFAFIIKGAGDGFGRGDNRLARADIGGLRPQEKMRIVERGLQPCFGDMRLEVERQCPEALEREKREQLDPGDRITGLALRQQIGQPRQGPVHRQQILDRFRKIGCQSSNGVEGHAIGGHTQPGASAPLR